MAEESGKVVEHIIDNVGVPTWQQGLAAAVNDTYSFTNNSSLFFGLLPTYMKDYAFRYVRPCLQWLDGYVYNLHSQGTSGIISTKIGKALVSGLTKQIVGEKLMFRLNVEQPNDIDKKNLKEVSKWALDNKIIKSIFAGIGFSLAAGTSLIKENHDIYGNVWWEGSRFDQNYYRTDFKGEVEDAVFLIRNYTDTRETKTDNQFFLCEHRFYELVDEKGVIIQKEDGTYDATEHKITKLPKVEYIVKRVKGTLNNGGADAPSIKESQTVNWQELPQWLRDNLRKDYSTIKVGEPQLLGFDYIGVEVLTNGYCDLSMPRAIHLGDSVLYPIISDMITYEIAASYKIRDMYLGKGTIYQPKSLSMGDVAMGGIKFGANNPLNNLPDKVELMKGVDPNTQKAIVEQFELRADQWQNVLDDCIRNMATKIGMSPKVISSYLLNSQTSMTATQIDSEDDISISWIYHERSYFRESLNKLLESSLNYMGIATNISLDFASPSLINKDRIIDRQTKLLDAGLTTVDEAIREIYPDLEEEQLLKKIADANITRQQKQEDELSELNFEDEEPMNNLFEEKQLKGSTKM